jgi:hypothetical protein
VITQKRGPVGELLKARFVVFGSKQLPGYNFEETFAPTLCKDLLHLVIIHISFRDLYYLQMDEKSAFFSRMLDRQILAE